MTLVSLLERKQPQVLLVISFIHVEKSPRLNLSVWLCNKEKGRYEGRGET